MNSATFNFDHRTKTHALFLAGYAIAFLISRWQSISPGYALDDYHLTLSSAMDLNTQLLGQGRYSFALLNSAIAHAGLQQTDFAVLGFFVLASFSALFYLRALQPKLTHPKTAFFLGALLASFPYLTEYTTFRQSHLPLGIVFLCCWFALGYYQRLRASGWNWSSAIYGLVAAEFALGMNQLALPLLVSAALFNEICLLPNERHTRFGKTPQSIAILLATVIALTAIYAILFFCTTHLFVVTADNSRATLLGLSQIQNRAHELVNLLTSLYLSRDSMTSFMAKAGVALSMAALIIFSLFRKGKDAALLSIIFLLLCTAIAVAPIAIGKTWWPVPRTLIAIPFAWTGALAILLPGTLPAWAWRLLHGSWLWSIFFFVGLNHSTLMDQQRVNRWDMAKAQAIVNAAGMKYPEQHGKLTLSSASWAYPAAPGAAVGDMNMSALSVDWAVDALFEEATGQTLDVSIDKNIDYACASKPKFPAEQSIFLMSDKVAICL